MQTIAFTSIQSWRALTSTPVVALPFSADDALPARTMELSAIRLAELFHRKPPLVPRSWKKLLRSTAPRPPNLSMSQITAGAVVCAGLAGIAMAVSTVDTVEGGGSATDKVKRELEQAKMAREIIDF